MFGVTRGCLLSPFIFILVVDYIYRQIYGYGIWIVGKLLQDVDFADDVGFIKADKQKLWGFLKKAEQYGLHIKAPKTKAKSISSSPMGIELGGEDIEKVPDFKYLGTSVASSQRIISETSTGLDINRIFA
ncbi:uncharacterized protein LOC136037595 [Artemia franciscana]|uniref:uncharacterized protein LOC136037593 n=1 Tax=Artemia franciscana TaxID=6661 RepID=UPI0032DA2D8F